MEHSNNNGKLIGALLIGALVGAAAGILFAPEKGDKLRGKIASGARDLADEIKSRVEAEVNNLRHKADQFGHRAEERAGDMANSVKQATDSIKNHN